MLIAFLFTAGGCAKPPEQEMADAKSAIEDARSLRAELYAIERHKKALEAHSKAQKAFETKRYREAKRFAVLTKEEADASILVARKNMESMREEARRTIDVLDSTLSEVYKVLENRKEEAKNRTLTAQMEAKTAVDEAKKMLESAMKGKRPSPDIEGLSSKLKIVEDSLGEIQTAVDRGEYLGAFEKATMIKERAADIKKQGEQKLAQMQSKKKSR